MRNVMFCGTILSIFPVLICFRFQRQYEIRQEVSLCDVDRLMFETTEVEIRNIKEHGWVEDEGGRIKVSEFATHFADKAGTQGNAKEKNVCGKLRIMKADPRESGFILG